MSAPAASGPPYVAVTGMVGAGKTTLARSLAEELGWSLMAESVDEDDNPWLARYYEDGGEPNRYALPLQLHFLLDRVDQIRAMTGAGRPFLADQCLEVDAEVFVRGHREEGVLTDDAFDLLWRTYENLRVAEGVKRPDLLVRLTAPFETILDRIQRRGRTPELEAEEDYWRRLYARFGREPLISDDIPELTLDARSYDVKAGDGHVRALARRITSALADAQVQTA